MAIKLHRCPFTFVHSGIDHCYPVQSALDAQGIDYEVTREFRFPRRRRQKIERLTGQHLLPVIEFEDGSVYREESADMAATIREGRLDSMRRRKTLDEDLTRGRHAPGEMRDTHTLTVRGRAPCGGTLKWI